MNLYESISMILITIAIVAVWSLLNFLMMLGWNYAISPTLGVGEVNFWKMAVIGAMAGLLFKATNGNSSWIGDRL